MPARSSTQRGALGNLAAARGDGLRFLAHGPQQRRVADRRANRVRIRILVANDVKGKHGREM